MPPGLAPAAQTSNRASRLARPISLSQGVAVAVGPGEGDGFGVAVPGVAVAGEGDALGFTVGEGAVVGLGLGLGDGTGVSGGSFVGLGVDVRVGSAVGPATVAVGVGAGDPPLFRAAITSAPAMPTPSARRTTPIVTRTFVAAGLPRRGRESRRLGPRSIRAVVCRRRMPPWRSTGLGARPGGAMVGAPGPGLGGTRRSAARNSAAVWKRSPGGNAKARASVASSSGEAERAKLRSSAGGTPSRCPATAAGVLPANGRRPATSS